MKRAQIILFSVFIVLTGVIYVALTYNKKEFSKKIKEEDKIVFVPVRKVKNDIRNIEIISYGQITPNTELLVSFELQGKLQKGQKTLKPGVKFRKGEILYRVDNEEAFFTLASRKSSLSNLVLNILPDIELDFPQERNKWIKFMNDTDPGKRLPELPKINSKKERMFITSRNIFTEYYNIRSTEARMDKYVYVAPFSGTIVEIYSEPGSIVNPGGQVAKIAKSGDFEVKVPIDLADIDLYREKNSAQFTNSAGKVIGEGSIIRLSDVINQQTQSADGYYRISPVENEKIYHGLFVNVKIDQKTNKETMALPRVAVVDNKVNILNDKDGLEQRDVLIVSRKPDTVFVTGLKNDLRVLLEQVEEDLENVKFKGVER